MGQRRRRSPLQRRRSLSPLSTLAAPARRTRSARLGSTWLSAADLVLLCELYLLKLRCTCPLSGSIGGINQGEVAAQRPTSLRRPRSEAASFLGVKVQVRGAGSLTASGGDVTAQLTCAGHLNSSPRILAPVLCARVQVSDSRWAAKDGNTVFAFVVLFVFSLSHLTPRSQTFITDSERVPRDAAASGSGPWRIRQVELR